MPQWSNSPPADQHGPSLRLRRTPGPGSLTAVATSSDMIGCPTHFYRHRTIPCEAPHCEACDSGFPWRWHGYLSAVDVKTNEHFLFEMTAQAAEDFKAYRERHLTLLGCLFQVHRLGDHRNGRVITQTKPADLTKIHLPAPPDLIKCLSHIWNLPTSDLELAGFTKSVQRVNVKPPTNGTAATTTATQTTQK